MAGTLLVCPPLSVLSCFPAASCQPECFLIRPLRISPPFPRPFLPVSLVADLYDSSNASVGSTVMSLYM